MIIPIIPPIIPLAISALDKKQSWKKQPGMKMKPMQTRLTLRKRSPYLAEGRPYPGPQQPAQSSHQHHPQHQPAMFDYGAARVQMQAEVTALAGQERARQIAQRRAPYNPSDPNRPYDQFAASRMRGGPTGRGRGEPGLTLRPLAPRSPRPAATQRGPVSGGS